MSRKIKSPLSELEAHSQKFRDEVINTSYNKLNNLIDGYESEKKLIINTATREIQRIKRLVSNKKDASSQIDYWNNIIQRTLQISRENYPHLHDISKEIITKFYNEIHCPYDEDINKISIKFLSRLLSLLINKFGISVIRNNKKDILKNLKFEGYLSKIKKLSNKATLVFLPTHYSHADSLLSGSLPYILDLPSFLYGAGLNLYSNTIISYFLKRVGTYTIDRTKKNIYYLETLKSYSQKTLEYGCNTIFYPGGGRSRDGKVETKLKLGLLSTVVEAQISMFEEKKEFASKIILVPISLSSECIIEAPSLIRESLGLKTENISLFKKLKSLFTFLFSESKSVVGIGKPMDILGNQVDDKGNSIDSKGNLIDIHNKSLKLLHNHEKSEKTSSLLPEELLNNIINEFNNWNFIFLGHLAAYTYFRILRKIFSNLSDDKFWKLDYRDTKVDFEIFYKELALNKKKLISSNVTQCLDPYIEKIDDKKILIDSIQRIGMYHENKIITLDEKYNLHTEDVPTLYYYHNKIANYEI